MLGLELGHLVVLRDSGNCAWGLVFSISWLGGFASVCATGFGVSCACLLWFWVWVVRVYCGLDFRGLLPIGLRC